MNIGFDETFMSAGDPMIRSSVPGFGNPNRIPGSRSIDRTRLKVTKESKPVQKGLARSCVAVQWHGDTATVRVKGSESLVGTLRRFEGKKGKAYGYKALTEQHSQSGFPSQKAALVALLERV